MKSQQMGVIYILTNPSFPEYVKIVEGSTARKYGIQILNLKKFINVIRNLIKIKINAILLTLLKNI